MLIRTLGTVPYLIFPSYASPTKTSWGYAMEFDLSYPRVWGTDWNLTQATVFTHDVGGISDTDIDCAQRVDALLTA